MRASVRGLRCLWFGSGGLNIGVGAFFRFDRLRLANWAGDTARPRCLGVCGILTPRGQCAHREQCAKNENSLPPPHGREITGKTFTRASVAPHMLDCDGYDFVPRSISSISYPSGASMKAILPLSLECGPSDKG